MTISASVQSLQVNRIFPNPDQPRKDFDPVAIEELAQSIKSNGLIQPITVVQAFRLKPHQRPPMSLNEILIPVQTDDDKELWSALNSNKKIPSRLQDSLDSLYAKLGNVSMVCESSLTNKGTVLENIRLLTLLPEIQGALNRGEISTLHAWQLTRMKGDDKQIKLYKLILAGKTDSLLIEPSSKAAAMTKLKALKRLEKLLVGRSPISSNQSKHPSMNLENVRLLKRLWS